MRVRRIAPLSSPGVPAATAAAAAIEASIVLTQRCICRPVGRWPGGANVTGTPIVSLALRRHCQSRYRKSRFIYRGFGAQAGGRGLGAINGGLAIRKILWGRS
jgi:hypothetical protein